MRLGRRRYELVWVGCRVRDAAWRDWLDRGIRLNGGGYMWGASPYEYWRVGPIVLRRYIQ